MKAPKKLPKSRKKVSNLRQLTAGKAQIMSPQVVRKLETEWQIFEMRRDGHTIHDIATALGISDPTVRLHLQEVLGRTIRETAETAEENRQLQIDRLDTLLVQYMAIAKQGNFAAAALVLQIEARRSKLLALDMPEVKKLDVTGIREYVGIDVSQV